MRLKLELRPTPEAGRKAALGIADEVRRLCAAWPSQAPGILEELQALIQGDIRRCDRRREALMRAGATRDERHQALLIGALEAADLAIDDLLHGQSCGRDGGGRVDETSKVAKARSAAACA